jgi:hypothetical protein
MRKFSFGLALALFAAASSAQSVIKFDVVFDQVYEASGAFAPNLVAVAPGPFNNNQPIAPPSLIAHVVMTAVASGTQITGTNTIWLNGSFSTESGNSPSNGWSTHTFNGAVFNLLKTGATNSFFATDFVTNPNDWPIFTATAANGYLSDHGPASGYGGTCPYFFGCLSAQPAGKGSGTGTYGLFASGTNIYNTGTSLPSFPTLANAGNYPLVSGTYSQTNASTGLGFDNGMDAFAFQGVLDTANSQGNGSSQPYLDGVNGYPGKVRILTFSSTGNTAYMVEGHLVTPVADTDSDGVPNTADNCRLVTNLNQADSDSDGYGNRCDGDMNQNLVTNSQDYVLFRQQLGQPSIAPTFNKADINANGVVNSQDYVLFRGLLGSPPGPGAGP